MTTSFQRIHLGFGIAVVAIVLMLIGALVAIDLRFGTYVVGNIPTNDSAEILVPLNKTMFTAAGKRLTDRQATPYAPDSLGDPFFTPAPPGETTALPLPPPFH